MATETAKISEIKGSAKETTKAVAPAAKSSKSNKCVVCGMKTNQKDGMCVLCRTGITQSYGELKELLNMKNKHG
jgi:hypothetical protein